MAKISGARYIAETFRGYGLTHVFYVEAILRRALVEMETLGIKRIVTHSEKAAAYMADGYARFRKKPGICMAQSVGAANLAAGLQDAYLARSPVIAITGRKPSIAQYRNAYQEINHFSMFLPVTKYNAFVDTPEQLPYLLPQAFRETTSGTPGPVHLDMLGYEGDSICIGEVDQHVIIEKSFSQLPARRPEPETHFIQEALTLISKSERSVIVAGAGIKTSGAEPLLIELAELLSIPVATSLDGKGIISDEHPLNIGVVGTYSNGQANKVVEEADLVIFIGTNTGDQVTNIWTLPKLGTKVIQIDISCSELGRNYPGTIGILGDAKASLSKLLKYSKHRKNLKWIRQVQKVVQEGYQELLPLLNSDSVPILPERLCKEISVSLPSDTVLVSDTGYAAIWTANAIKLNGLDQKYFRAAGSLGWAFPASLGIKCAALERPVICFTGDGGFLYHISELETAKRWNINTVTIINNNSMFAQALVGINRSYGKKTGRKEDMYKFIDVDYAKIADDFGCFGIRVTKPEEIRDALQTALKADKPSIVDVVTDGYHAAPWTKPTGPIVKLN